MSVIKKSLEDREFSKESITFIFGLGLGYKVWEILDRMEKGHIIFIIEQDRRIIDYSLKLQDFSGAIREEKLIFCIPREEAIRQRIEQNSSRLLDGKITLEMENFCPKLSPLYSRLYKNCQQLCNTIFLSYNTFLGLSDTFMVNELKNLSKTALALKTDGFCQGNFKDIPAILVATGPSLQKNINLLKEARGKALIIAVGQALRVLLAYDIVPDIICSIDFGEPNYLDLEDVILGANIPLLIDGRIYPRIPREYQGDIIIPIGSDDILFPYTDEHKERVNRGKTVVQIGLNLALAMGANPIIFTGQDLAYSEMSHTSGVSVNSQTKVELNGRQIIESNKIGRMTSEAFWVESIYGDKVLTNRVLMSYLEDLENTIRNCPDRLFIDATEGGARIKGTQIMTLRAVLDQYAQREHDFGQLIEQSKSQLNPDLKRLIHELNSVNVLVEKVVTLNKKLEKPILMLKKLLPAADTDSFSDGQRKQFEEISNRVAQGFDQIVRTVQSHHILRSPIAKLRHILMQRENKFNKDDSPYHKSKITLQRYDLAYKGFDRIIGQIKNALDNTLPYLKEYQRLKNPKKGTLTKEEFHFRLGCCLEKMGYLNKAIIEFEQALATDYRMKESIEHLVDICLRLEDFAGAGDVLERFGHVSTIDREKISGMIKSEEQRALERYLAKAVERFGEGDFANALNYSRRVLAIDSGSGEAKDILAKSLEQRQEKIASTQLEVQEFRERLERKKRRGCRFNEAKSMVQEYRFTEAVDLYKGILTEDEHPEIHFGLSRAYQGLANWEAATEQIQWLIERYPGRAQLYVDLGNIYLSQAKYKEAFSEYHKAIDTDKDFINLYLKMANVCVHLGKVQEAVQHYEDYLTQNPADYNSLVKLGDCYLLLGVKEAARLGYEAALRIQPTCTWAAERLSRLTRVSALG